jgi:hypothetical protein
MLCNNVAARATPQEPRAIVQFGSFYCITAAQQRRSTYSAILAMLYILWSLLCGLCKSMLQALKST